MIFYWFHVVDILNTLSIIVFSLSLITVTGSLIIKLYYFDEIKSEEYIISSGILKKAIIIAIISFLVMMFCPDKHTLIEMWISNNAEYGIESIKDATDYIINAIKEIN